MPRLARERFSFEFENRNPDVWGVFRFRPDSFLPLRRFLPHSFEVISMTASFLRKNYGVALFLSLLIFYFIFFFLMTYFTPLFTDDLSYSYYYKDWLLGRESFPGLEPWIRMIKTHFMGINGRFGDKLLIGYLILPKFVQAFLASIAGLAMVTGACKLAFGKISAHPVLSMGTLLAIAMLMPWNDTMWQGCMIVNYVMGGALGMWALYLFFRPVKVGPRFRILKYAGVLFLGFLAGSWHECFSFIMVPGILVYLICVRKLDKIQFLMFAGLFLGGVFIISNPGFWLRYNNSMRVMGMHHADMIFQYANIGLLIVLLCPLLLAIPSARKHYSVADRYILVAAAASMILNTFIFLSNLDMPRALWYGLLVSLTGIGISVRPLYGKRVSRNIIRIVVGMATVFFIVHAVVCVIWQIRLKREYDDIVRQYMKSPYGEVFNDQKAAESLPWIALGRTSYLQFRTWRIDHGVAPFYKKKGELLHVVPVTLESFSPSESRRLPGEDEMYIFHNEVVASPIDGRIMRWRKIVCEDKEGRKTAFFVVVQRFHDKEGNAWEYWAIRNAENIKELKSLTR